MKKLQAIVAAFLFVAIGAFAFVPATTVNAAALDGICNEVGNEGAVCANRDDDAEGFVGTLVNVLLYIVGAVSVLAIIIGGILYVVSGGNSANVTKAKNTIVYAIVGLVVSFLAYAIVNWVVRLF